MRLGNICSVSAGQGAPQGQDYYASSGPNVFIRVSDLDAVLASDTEKSASHVTDQAIATYKLKQYPANSIIFAKSGISCTKNRVYLTKEPCYIVSHLCVLHSFCDKINPLWLVRFLRAFDVSKLVNDPSYPSISLKAISDLNIPDLPFEIQFAQANSLSTIETAIKNKKRQIGELDDLVKSRFIEMFEDKGFEDKPLIEFSLSKGEYGAQSAACSYDPSRPRYVRITDINEDGTLNDDCVNSSIPSDDADYLLEYGDFLFARMGATVGKTYAFFQGNQIYAGYLIRFKLDTNRINPRYLFWFTKTRRYLEWVADNQSGAAQPGINAKKYSDMPVIDAPIELQNRFATFVELIDKSKLILQKQIKDLEELLECKTEEFFGGDE